MPVLVSLGMNSSLILHTGLNFAFETVGLEGASAGKACETSRKQLNFAFETVGLEGARAGKACETSRKQLNFAFETVGLEGQVQAKRARRHANS